jgi:glycerol-3-phosphate acyltransferase PlsY
MKKYLNPVLKGVLSLLLVSPILGTLGIFPPPTRDLYNSDLAFAFINALMSSGYIMVIMAVCFLVAIILLWTKRTAAAALLILPFTVNIVGFHLMLDGGLFTAGAIMGNVLLILNVYFLWQHRTTYKQLLAAKSK